MSDDRIVIGTYGVELDCFKVISESLEKTDKEAANRINQREAKEIRNAVRREIRDAAAAPMAKPPDVWTTYWAAKEKVELLLKNPDVSFASKAERVLEDVFRGHAREITEQAILETTVWVVQDAETGEQMADGNQYQGILPLCNRSRGGMTIGPPVTYTPMVFEIPKPETLQEKRSFGRAYEAFGSAPVVFLGNDASYGKDTYQQLEQGEDGVFRPVGRPRQFSPFHWMERIINLKTLSPMKSETGTVVTHLTLEEQEENLVDAALKDKKWSMDEIQAYVDLCMGVEIAYKKSDMKKELLGIYNRKSTKFLEGARELLKTLLLGELNIDALRLKDTEIPYDHLELRTSGGKYYVLELKGNVVHREWGVEGIEHTHRTAQKTCKDVEAAKKEFRRIMNSQLNDGYRSEL